MSKQTELAQVADTITVDSGNVGIGTSSLTGTLSVVDSTSTDTLYLESSDTARITLKDTSAYAQGTGPYIQFQGLDNAGTNRNFGQIWGISDTSNNGELDFKVRSSGSMISAMRIDSAGRVTKPSQPYFNVAKNSSSYTLSTNDTFVFTRVMSNTGGHYNSSTGRFTAPVAGKYLFIFQTIVRGTYNSAAIKYYKNGSRFYGGEMHFSPNPTSNSWTNVTNNQIVTMNANDYIEVRNLGFTVTYHGDHWAHFTGMLLG